MFRAEAGPGQLVLADREFLGVPLRRAFTATGADLLWRVPANRVLPVNEQFRDGSWLSRIEAGSGPAPEEPVSAGQGDLKRWHRTGRWRQLGQIGQRPGDIPRTQVDVLAVDQPHISPCSRSNRTLSGPAPRALVGLQRLTP
ncbi:hypothetical protein ACFCYX_33140 [Streptomyces populi]|uniref:hypothetical protein n=1 Tax=Streptomyces populi TaxID=2058924 RepID=UPI0013A6E49A|nr:hypothetical protein [Streptomyces populi]